MLNTLGEWADTLGVLIASVGVLATSVGVLILFIQLKRDKETTKDEAIRRKKEATLEIYVQWYDEIHEKDARLRKLYEIDVHGGKTILTQADVQDIYSHGKGDERVLLLDILRGLERIALAVEEGIYDYDFLFKSSRTQLMSFYGVYFHYIQEARKRQPTAYSCYCTLISKFDHDSLRHDLAVSKAYRAAVNRNESSGNDL